MRNGNGTGNGHYCPLDLVENYLRRFVVYPSEHAITAHVLWTGHTHFMNLWDTTPRLAFMSPLPESGKTRALEVTELFVPFPRMAFSMSAASMVRVIAKGHENKEIPTILYDEIDNVFSKSEEGMSDLRAALNAGYRRNARSTRCINKGEGVVDFPSYAALAVAGLKELPPALATRAIFIHMRRRAPDEPKEDFRLKYHTAEAKPIMEALEQWAIEVETAISVDEVAMPPEITDRAADIWEPLLAVADAAGGDWPDRARAAAIYLTGAAKDDTVTGAVELLSHIKDAFLDADKIHTTTLLDRLHGRDESPWLDIRGKPLTGRQLADMLRPYRIKSAQVKISGTNHQGYHRSDYELAWKSYLPGGDPTAPTAPTNLMNKNKKVGLVGSVGSGEGKTPTWEPGAFEPDFEEGAAA